MAVWERLCGRVTRFRGTENLYSPRIMFRKIQSRTVLLLVSVGRRTQKEAFNDSRGRELVP